jgi:FAD synthetase
MHQIWGFYVITPNNCIVLAGENYRFGYKAAGDALELVRLCKEYNLDAFIVSSVMDNNLKSNNGSLKAINARDKGQVSSTRVRQALSIGDMQYVTQLLGRKHRLILKTDENCFCSENRILSTKTNLLNQPPGDGVYHNCTVLVGDMSVGTCRVVIDATSIIIELDSENFWPVDASKFGQLIGIEFS